MPHVDSQSVCESTGDAMSALEDTSGTASPETSHHRAAVKRFAALSIGDVVSKCAQLGTSIYLARILGVLSFGTVNYFQAAAVLIAMGADCGMEWQGTHFLARVWRQGDRRNLLPNTFNEVTSFRLVLAAGLYGIWWLASYWSPYLGSHRSLLLTYGLSIFVAAALPEWILVAIGRATVIAIGRVIRTFALLFLVVLLVHGPADEALVGATYTAAFGLAAIWLLWYLWQRWRWRPRFSVERKPLSRLAKAVPYFAFTALQQIFFLLALMVSRLCVDAEAVGLYAAAYRLIMAFVPFTLYVVTALMPIIGAASESNLTDLVALYATRYVSLVLPFVVIAGFEARTVLIVTMGVPYAAAAPILAVFSYSLPALGVALLAAAALNQSGKSIQVMVTVLASAVLLVPAAYVAVLGLGTAGIAVATGTILIGCALALCAMVRGLLRRCLPLLIGMSILAIAVRLSMSVIVEEMRIFSTSLGHVYLDAIVLGIYLVALRFTPMDPLALILIRRRKSLRCGVSRNGATDVD